MSSLPNPTLANRLMTQLVSILQSKNNAKTITRFKELLQLDKVDNTRDVEKPISNSTIAAIVTGDISGQRRTEMSYIQTEASSTWVISHNLQKYPTVSVVDSQGDDIFGDVHHFDQNSLQIWFCVPMTGSAHLS